VIGEVAMVLSTLKALNDGIAVLKESKGNLSDILGKWGDVEEKVLDVERRKVGTMSYKEALDMESAKRQLINFDRQLKDICIMQGQADLYFSIKKRMEEAQAQHIKNIKKMKLRNIERRKTFNLIATIVLVVVCFWFVAFGIFTVLTR
tara:strand:+ start:742 stop:1185 length:444 start_codon:yes stop_codon:yes gene_type:complete